MDDGTLDEVFCDECEDEAASKRCVQCKDNFCDMCYVLQHRRGARAQHTTESLLEAPEHDSPAGSESDEASNMHDKAKDIKAREGGFVCFQRAASALGRLVTSEVVSSPTSAIGNWWQFHPDGDWFVERSKYVPLRLPLADRKFMRLVQAALHVSEPPCDTLLVSTVSAKARMKAFMERLRSLSAVLTGLIACESTTAGTLLLEGDIELKPKGVTFQTLFELTRRHKVRNPEKMRTAYGKLIMLMQDCQREDVQEEMEVQCVRPVDTVAALIARSGGSELLRDPLLPLATGEIIQRVPYKLTAQDIRRKEGAAKKLVRKYTTRNFNREAVRQCLLSFGDNHNYLRFNRDPCQGMLTLLQRHFDPNKPGRFSLAIVEGQDGARLTHDHQHQYIFVQQTLSLWRNILHHMYKLWMLADEDLLDASNPYVLEDTEQGVQRVQACPRLTRAMRKIVYETQQELSDQSCGWVGSSVVHLGDTNVPNALAFIDKYNQVPRILRPLLSCCDQMERIATERTNVRDYFNQAHGGVAQLRLEILSDFFRSAFDGSGADSFFSAGSCIDGRLTSAWNWCNQIEQKSYYRALLLTGFTSFDGQFHSEYD